MSSSRVGKAPIPPGLPAAQQIVVAIDGVMHCENFYALSQGLGSAQPAEAMQWAIFRMTRRPPPQMRKR
ncbi:hypothetical protein AU476_15955 [Cupriavidus sp. UYMSc13B]|nr:hypothetical protein AU476_15955 [Cupriavidus sp. UYMSc13B]